MKFIFLILFSCATKEERENNQKALNELIVQENTSNQRDLSSSAFDPEYLANKNTYKTSSPTADWNPIIIYNLNSFAFEDGNYAIWLNTGGKVTSPKVTDLRVEIRCVKRTCQQLRSNALVAIEDTSLSLDPSRNVIVTTNFRTKEISVKLSQSLKNYFTSTAPGKTFSLSLRLFKLPAKQIYQRQVASKNPLPVVFFQAQTFTVPSVLIPISSKK